MNRVRRRQNAFVLLLCWIFVFLLFTGCVKNTEGYQSVKLGADIPVDNSSAKAPLIVIHGLFGAELYAENNEKVWGKFSNLRTLDKKLIKQLAFDDLKVGSIMSHAEISPGNVAVYRLKNYSLLLNALKKFGYTGKNLFVYAYDWRKSVPENAAGLHSFITEKEKLFSKGQKFNILAHSMGGLITRYYLQYGVNRLPEKGFPALSNDGSDKISKVFIFGTPNCGYTDTVTELCSGLAFVRGAVKYPAAMLGTFKSYFCMMPHPAAMAFVYSDDGSPVDIYDIETWKKLRWGLADKKLSSYLFSSEQEALDCLEKNLAVGKKFIFAMHQPMKRKKGLKLYLFAGNAFDTAAQCMVNRRTGRITVKKYAPGDGKILFNSVRGHDLVPWDGLYLFGASHMGLFNSNDALRNLNYLLTESSANER